MNIQDSTYQSNCYRAFTQNKKDLSLCNNLSGETKEICYMGYVEAVSVGQEFCKNNFTYEKWRDACLYRVAVNSQDADICYQLDSVLDRNFCFSEIAIKAGNVKICDKIQGISSAEDYRNGCIGAIQKFE